MVALVGVVGCDYEDRVLVPRHSLRLVEELPQGVVGIANTLVYRQSLLRELTLIFVGNDKRVM